MKRIIPVATVVAAAVTVAVLAARYTQPAPGCPRCGAPCGACHPKADPRDHSALTVPSPEPADA